MSMLRIALLQLTAYGTDQAANLHKGIEYCRRAKGLGADIALFPEMWNIGYTRYDAAAPGAREAWQGQAIGADGEFVSRFRHLAKELGMAIAITYLEAWPVVDPLQGGAPRNSVSLIDGKGKIVMTYAKVHTCDFRTMELGCTPGTDFSVCSLETAAGPIRVGAMICYDREAPESARVLMLKGAELVLTPNACGLDDRRINQFGTRAFENAMAVAMANYAEPQQNGRSVAFGADGNLLVQADRGEDIYLVDLDLDKVRAHRATTIWGNAFRRPHRYGLLVSQEVDEPFVRKNADGEPFDRSRR
jgi:predicted amidohydrolase